MSPSDSMSSNTVDMATIKSYLGLSSTNLGSYDVRRIRGDATGVSMNQNPISLDQLRGASILTHSQYNNATGYITGGVAASVYPWTSNWNYILEPGTYGVSDDGEWWNPDLGGPTNAEYVSRSVICKA